MDSEGQTECRQENWEQHEVTCACIDVSGESSAGVKSRGPGQTNLGLSLGTITSCSMTLVSHFTSLNSGLFTCKAG